MSVWGLNAVCLIESGYSFAGIKVAAVTICCFTASNGNVKNAQSCAITFQLVFVSWCLIMHRETLPLISVLCYTVFCPVFCTVADTAAI